jgi:hypothetical protein
VKPEEIAETASLLEGIKSRMLKSSGGKERRASALLFGVACNWALDSGIPISGLVDELFAIARDRSEEV